MNIYPFIDNLFENNDISFVKCENIFVIIKNIFVSDGSKNFSDGLKLYFGRSES